MAKQKAVHKTISNRRASYDFDLQESYRAGLVLTGAEVKSLRLGHGHLRGAYVTLKDGEAWLLNATITPLSTNRAHLTEDDQTRTRKLLLKKKEIVQLQAAKQQGFTIVPLRILNGMRHIKIEIATARGKRKYDKREVIKKRDTDRDIQRSL